MNKILLALTLALSAQAFAITRVINCFDAQTNNLEIQIVLRGGNAFMNVCTGDVCTDRNMVHVQTLMLNQTDATDQVLHYIPVSGQALPVRQTLEILFQGQEGDPVHVLIDGAQTGFSCI